MATKRKSCGASMKSDAQKELKKMQAEAMKAAKKVEAEMKKAAQKAVAFVKKNPGKSAAIAAGAGAAIGSAITALLSGGGKKRKK
ncbi:MAG: hypothetical protein ACOYS2_03045 [Patescibacteria group bacterium]